MLSSISTPALTGYIIAIIVLVILSAYFSATETAYSSANRIRLKNMENNGSKRARRVLHQIDNYDKLLTTVLIGNNIVNIAMASLATVMFTALLKGASYAAAVSTLVTTVVVLICGEITPKSLAKEHAEAFAMFSSPIVNVLEIIFWPLTALFSLFKRLFKTKKTSAYTEDELITIVEEAESDGEIDRHESELIRSAIEFDDVDVYDIMVPRVDVIAIEDTESMDEIAAKFQDNGFSRMPVYHESIDSVIGVVHIKDFYELYKNNGTDLSSIISGSLCVARNMKISAALRMFQKAKIHMAIVVDEFGGTAGIITLEDILEELVGEIYDEHDEEEVLLRQEDEFTYIVNGSYSLDELSYELDIKGTDDFESSTVGGWVTELMKRIPLSGETLTYRNLDMTVLKATARKILEVKIVVRPEDPDEEEDKDRDKEREKFKEKDKAKE